jgi:ligand-binding sensor domain-containing protein
MKQWRIWYLIPYIYLNPLFFATGVAAQIPLHFDHLGRAEGLSQNSVNCMVRDSEGFMWFGTQDGLNRYDGKEIRLYQNDPDNPSTLSNNYILSICEDEEGFLWIGTMAGGLNRFNRETGEFSVFRHSDTSNSLSENNVWAVLSDGKGHIWAGTSLGLNCYDKKAGKFRLFRHLENDTSGLACDMVISLWKDSKGIIWAGTTEGLCRFDPETEKFTTWLNIRSAESKDENIIWSVTGDSTGKIYTGTNNGLFALDPGSGTVIRLIGSTGSEQFVVWSLFAETDRIIWAGTARGLYRIDTGDRSFGLFRHDPGDPKTLRNDNIWYILRDPSGNLWVGTKNGVSWAKTFTAGFRLMNSDPAQPVHLSSPKVMAILEDSRGRLWIGTDGGGLNCFTPGWKNRTVFTSENSAIRNNAVWALAEDREGNIWIGNYLGGLHLLPASGGPIKALPLRDEDTYALHNDRVLAILPGDDGIIWIGTRNGGLVRYDPGTRQFKKYLHTHGDTTSISANTVLSLAFDRHKRIWVGLHEGGLNLFDPKTDKFISFTKSNSGLSDDNVWAILFDRKGRMWLGTQGGLNFAEHPGPGMQFHCLSTHHGLSGNMILGVLEDFSGNIWCSGFNGLSRLNIQAFESSIVPEQNRDPFEGPLFRNFDTDHGLQGLEFNQGACFKDRKGILWFGGNNGANYFNANDIRESAFLPPLIITEFRIFNKVVQVMPFIVEETQYKARIIKKENNYYLPAEISHIRELTLSFRESVISFDFVALDLSNPSKNQYAYKLSGFDKTWNFIGSQNVATYTNLNPGHYTLMVRGTNSDGVWNPQEARLKITITPPFWRTWWFLSLLASLFVFGIWGIFNDQKQKARKEKEMIELQLKTIRSQMDPHFAFNALNTVASFIYEGDPDATYDYFTRFAHMIRNILKDHDRISRTLQEELEFVKNYLELQKVRFSDRFNYFIHVDEGIPARTEVPKMIIQSHAENAIKHGLIHRQKGGLLKINVENRDSCILITIEDNGIGRKKAAELSTGSTGLGFKIMDQIISLYRKLFHAEITQTIEDLTDDAGNPEGTRIILTICTTPGRKIRNRFLRINTKITNYEK